MRLAWLTVIATLLGLAGGPAFADTYPSRSIRLVVRSRPAARPISSPD